MILFILKNERIHGKCEFLINMVSRSLRSSWAPNVKHVSVQFYNVHNYSDSLMCERCLLVDNQRGEQSLSPFFILSPTHNICLCSLSPIRLRQTPILSICLHTTNINYHAVLMCTYRQAITSLYHSAVDGWLYTERNGKCTLTGMCLCCTAYSNICSARVTASKTRFGVGDVSSKLFIVMVDYCCWCEGEQAVFISFISFILYVKNAVVLSFERMTKKSEQRERWALLGKVDNIMAVNMFALLVVCNV